MAVTGLDYNSPANWLSLGADAIAKIKRGYAQGWAQLPNILESAQAQSRPPSQGYYGPGQAQPAQPQQYPINKTPQATGVGAPVSWPPQGFPQVGLGAMAPQPLNTQTQAQAGSPIANPGTGTTSNKPPITRTANSWMDSPGLDRAKVSPNASQALKIASGTVASQELDQNAALASSPIDQFGPLSARNVVAPQVTPNTQYGLPPEVTPELTAGSQAAAELDAPKNWMQKMATPQGRDFIAMIGQMLAAKGSTYGNEPPASLGYATAARGVTQQALANDWSTRLATDPNAKPPSTLAPESQKQVMSIHEHKAQNEQRKFERQYRMEELDVQKQRLAAQAELDKLETAFKEKELTLREKVANGTLAQQDFENSLMPGKIAIQNKQLQIADIEANTANLRARNEAQFGGMTPAQSAVDRRMMAAQRLKLLEQYSPEEVDQMMADAYGETPRIPTADASGRMAKPAADRQATLADIQALLQKHPNDPKLLQALEMLKSGKITAIPIKAGSTFYNELVGGK